MDQHIFSSARLFFMAHKGGITSKLDNHNMDEFFYGNFWKWIFVRWVAPLVVFRWLYSDTFAGEEEKKSLMEDLGRLKDDFLLRKFQEADSTADLYTAVSLDAVSSQTDLTGGAEVRNM